MAHPEETDMEDDFQFRWGKKGGAGRKKGVQFYESFTYEGVKYSLYDCVHVYRTGELETDIGKLVKIYDTEDHRRKIKLVWFFRPSEIRNFLGDCEPCWNEIFLASGEGVGLSNINPLESIQGKCNVVCTSKDKRNPQPSEEELRMASYIFCHTFDVGTRTILENFPNEIGGTKVESFFNAGNSQKLIRTPKFQTNLRDQAGPSNVLSKLGLDKVVASPVENDKSSSRLSPVLKESKKAVVCIGEDSNEALKRKPYMRASDTHQHKKVIVLPGVASKFQTNLRDQDGPSNMSSKLGLDKVVASSVKNDKSSSRGSPVMKESKKAVVGIGENSNETLRPKPYMRTSDTHPHKRIIVLPGVASTKGESSEHKTSKTAGNAVTQHAGDRGVKTNSKPLGIMEERRNWFKPLPWEQRLQRAQDAGNLVLLDNLDPSYASSEVEDLVWNALQEKVEAKMIQCSTLSNPYYGKAFVIFKSKIAAESAISELKRRCLIMADGRPVIGMRRTLKEPEKTSRFVGHLTIDKIRLQSQREEMRKAVSTGHCSQPNTIEYDMAMEWCLLQERSDLWWKALHKLPSLQEQMKEIEPLRRQLKSIIN